MKILYVVLGILVSFNITLQLVDPIQTERERTIVKIQSLQSCYYTAVKFGKMDPDKSSEFCSKHSEDTTNNFADIAQKMDEITDNRYSPKNFYTHKLKEYFKF